MLSGIVYIFSYLYKSEIWPDWTEMQKYKSKAPSNNNREAFAVAFQTYLDDKKGLLKASPIAYSYMDHFVPYVTVAK